MDDVLRMLENLPGVGLSNSKNVNVSGMNVRQYDYSKNGSDFSVSVVGPTNNNFYVLEYTKDKDFTDDYTRIRDIYQQANKPRDVLPTAGRIQRR